VHSVLRAISVEVRSFAQVGVSLTVDKLASTVRSALNSRWGEGRESGEKASGAKALVFLARLSARLRSCPDTSSHRKRELSRSEMLRLQGHLSYSGLKPRTSFSARSCATIMAAMISCAVACMALEPTTPLASYGRQSWVMENGLPQNTVQSLVQTRDGFVWLGTEVGLVRFDGTGFQVFGNSKIHRRHSRRLEDPGKPGASFEG